jgi:2-octaprenyl-6-methoxyphenol hydroxylase
MNENYDIVIAGAGLAATSLIAALSHAGFSIAVLETHLPELPKQSADSRPLSLTYGSKRILETVGIWQELAPQAEAIQTVHVSQANHFGVLRFRAEEEGVPALGYVVSFDELQNLLYQRAARMQSVQFIPIEKITDIQYQAGKTAVTVQTIQGQKMLHAQLFAAADGAHSPSRDLLGIPAIEKTSDDVALTALVELAEGHQHCAYERFTEQGIIAVLPLRNVNRCRIVWSLPKTLAATVAEWSDQQLAKYLQNALHDRLGDWRLLERGKVFPLQTVQAVEQIAKGAVLLGNAAHTLYPVAAQGFNLGLCDNAVLAEILVEARRQGLALGDRAVLTQYINRRRADQRWISGFTGAIGQFFDCQIPGLAAIRGVGLLATDLLTPLKRRLARRLLGLAGKTPKLSLGIPLTYS